MGQEASVPMDPDLEEQARAPPSSTNPPLPTPNPPPPPPPPPTLPPGTTSAGSAAALGLPTINRAFTAASAAVRHGSVKAGMGGNVAPQQQQQQQQHPQNEYEVREAARAAAAGGNLYLDPAEPWQPYMVGHETHDGLVSQGTASSRGPLHPHPKSPPRGAVGLASSDPAATASSSPPSSSNQPVAVGGVPTGSKRGLFGNSSRALAHSRGAALIHSMRNLNLGKALSGKGGSGVGQGGPSHPTGKPQLDWERQWDADVDEDSDDEDEYDDGAAVDRAGNAAVAVAQHLKHDDGASGPLVPTPGYGPQPPLEVQQLAPPSATVAPIYASSTQSLSSSSAASSYRPAQELHAQLPILAPPQPEDLLSKPLETSPSVEAGKPCVEMFLPMLRVLGKGSFGKVVLVQKRIGKERGQLFAMKILKKTYLVKRRQIERTRTERKVLSAVNHPFIMKLHYAFQTEDKLYLVLDYCPGGELFFHLSRCRRFPERVARFYAAELLLAVAHVHKHSIVYRDLKPENILLDADGHVKLGDFGLAKAGITSPVEGAHSMCGTPEYMAPEVLSQQGHGFCVDYWGLGMLTYEMMTGLPPWYTTDRQKLFRRLKSAPLDIPNFFSPAAADCVAALLERNPRRRLGVAGVRSAMEHEFFRNISWRSLYARRVEAPIKPCESWKPPDATNAHTNGDLDLLSMPSSTVANLAEIEKIDSGELDAATSNFDATFLRMPVESEDIPVEDPEDAAAAEELHDDTFLGFTFDIRERDRPGPSPHEARQRTHHYQQP